MNNIIKEAKAKYTEERTAYETADGELEAKIDKAKIRLDRLEKKRAKLHHPSWIDLILKPIAEAMLKHLPNRTFEILGPFGITCETAIHFNKKEVDKKDKFKGDNCIGITFRPATKLPDLTVVDWKTDTKQFKPGTIGYMNNMNHLAIPIQDDIEWLLSFMLRPE